jgi:hypothetical protein
VDKSTNTPRVVELRVASRVQFHVQEILNVAVGALEIVCAKAETAVNLLASLLCVALGEFGGRDRGEVRGRIRGQGQQQRQADLRVKAPLRVRLHEGPERVVDSLMTARKEREGGSGDQIFGLLCQWPSGP